MITELVAPSMPKAKFKYSPFVQAGPYIQSAGLVGLDPSTGQLVVGGPGAETRQILSNLAAALKELDLKVDDLVIARIFTTSMARFSEINMEWDAFFENRSILPARTAVGVSALPISASVEIEFQFYKEK